MISVDSPDLGERIKRIRMGKGLSQIALADLAGVSNGYLSSIESGARPSAKILDKLMTGLRATNGSVEVEEEDSLEVLMQKIVDMGYDVTVTRRHK